MEQADVTEGIFACGKPVALKRGGDVRVREIQIEDLPIIGTELASMLGNVDSEALEGDRSTANLTKLILSSTDLVTAMKRVLAQLTDEPPSKFDSLPIVDMLKLARAFFEVNDIEELKEHFFALRQMTQKSSSAANEK